MATSEPKPRGNFQMEPFDEKATTWNRWVKRFETALAIFGTSEAMKAKYLLHFMGTEAYNKLCDKALPLIPEELQYDNICELLEKHYNPKPNEIFLNFKFHSRKQEPTESAAEYLVALRHLATGCGFGEYLDKALRNQFVYGIGNRKIQGRLLEKDDLTLDDAIHLANMFEQAEKGFQEMNKQQEAVDMVNMRKTKEREKRVRETEQRARSKLNTNCDRCGSSKHNSNDCRHINSVCNFCRKRGHLRRVCFKARSTMKQISDGEVSGKEDSEQEVCKMESNGQSPSIRDKILCTLEVNDRNITFEVDTGAPVTIISLADAYKYFSKKIRIHEPDLELYSYCKTPIDCAGYIWVKVRAKDITKVKMYLVRANRKPLLGREWLRLVKLDWLKMLKGKSVSSVSVNKIQESANLEGQLRSILEKYPNLFSKSVGKIRGFQARLNIKTDAVPKCMKARRVPFPLLQRVEDELDDQVKAGLLEKVERSEWATPIVVVRKKDDKIRICGDYKITINPVLVVDKHPLPTVDELFSTMAGGEKYSKIDLSKAYLQLEVHPDDQKFLTLSTHKGLFQPTRLMFGVASAPSQWQRLMEQLLADIPGVKVFLDDIKITAKDERTHLDRLEEVLKRLDRYNMRINLAKSEFLRESIEYCGYVIDRQGIRKIPAKIKAIQEMRYPATKDEVRSFLGLVNYYGRFIKNLSSIVYPLNRLLHKEVPFNFDAKCKWAFEEVKRQVGSEVVLTHYDPRKKLTLAVDASPTGVGAVLSHEFGDGTERPIQFASQTLNATQRRYSQVDKEAYAVIFGVKKFFQYVYGREFTLITDNKAISQIFAPDKGLPVLSATRMQHYAVFLESFDYKIRLRKSKENGNADALSRLPVNECSKTISEIDQIEMELIENLPITVKELGQATKKDAEVRRLVDSLSYGRKCDPADSFGIDPSEFSLQQGCLLRGIRVYVPKPLRTRIIQELHSGHFGVSKMKSLARAYCWWKNLDKDIEKAVADCYECQIGRPDVKKEPVHCWLPPKKVFERVHVDYAGPFLGKYFFVLVDAFSKWPEVRIVRDITTETTIEVCRSIFAQFGIPNILVSDHGTQFKSAKFQEFLKQNGIMHKLGAPYHPATNGQAERFIQTFKTKLKAMPRKEELQRKIDQILLAYRRAIHPVTNKSPAMTMFGRQIQSRLDLLLPNNEVRDPERQKTTRELAVGDAVMARDYMDKLKWKPGIVRERIGDLHYKVRLEDGRCWNRHIDQLRKINGRVMLDSEVEETHSASYEPSDLTLEKRENPTSMSNAEREATDECVMSDNRDQSFATPPSSPGSAFIGFEEPAGNGEAVNIRTNPRRNIRRPHRLNDYVIDTD
ncbi:uncharacterized protein K02A2.6-like [Musca domestica]|uniref:RNA-directed DNA polymerase n=1 Tax=Musca domestica TaxID=7370 RepID=A0ABM3V5D8_MUSDO|nr:uncharacterized protein K02A2.6-like [Musca domestica]